MFHLMKWHVDQCFGCADVHWPPIEEDDFTAGATGRFCQEFVADRLDVMSKEVGPYFQFIGGVFAWAMHCAIFPFPEYNFNHAKCSIQSNQDIWRMCYCTQLTNEQC